MQNTRVQKYIVYRMYGCMQQTADETVDLGSRLLNVNNLISPISQSGYERSLGWSAESFCCFTSISFY